MSDDPNTTEAKDPVLYRVRDGVARLVLNRPKRRNALSAPMVNALHRHLSDANADAEVRVIVISGKGPGFCAGADLKDPPGAPQAEGAEPNVPFADVLEAIWNGPKPVIAQVHGAAFAGGLGLVGAADLVIVSDDAKFSFSEVRIGVIPAIISVVCLRKLGRHHGMRLLLTGDRFDGAEAVRVGLAHRCVPGEHLDFEVAKEVEALRLGGPNALAECKKLVREIPNLSLEDGFERASEWSARMFRTEEAQEGMAAFREKRKPNWVANPQTTGADPEHD